MHDPNEIYIIQDEEGEMVACGRSTNDAWRSAEMCFGETTLELREIGFKLVVGKAVVNE